MTKKESKNLNIFKPIATLIIIIILLVIGACGWQLYHSRQQIQALRTELIQNQSALTQQNATLQNTQVKVAQLVKISGYNQANWVLPEVKYLLNLADINLTINNNIPVAVKLLQLADRRVASLNETSLNSLRRVFINDINNLQAAPHVDSIGILLRINALNNQIGQLAFIPKAPVKAATKEAEVVLKNQTLWQKFYNNALKLLENIVIIRHHDSRIEPVLTKDQQVYLIQNIHLLLEQAKWSLLHRNNSVYKSSLQQTTAQLKLGFSHNLTAAENILTSLQKLQKLDVAPPIPNINSSIQELHKVMQKTVTDRASS